VIQLLNNEISRFEVRHCLGFYPTQRIARAVKTPSTSSLLLKVHITSTRIEDTTHSARTTADQIIKMSLLNSQGSSQMDLYDQDSYSIPEEDLRSIGTGHSSDDDVDNTSMATDSKLHQQHSKQVHDVTTPPNNIVTTTSPLEWTSSTRKKLWERSRKQNMLGTQDHFDPSTSDRDLPHFRGRSMEEVQQGLMESITTDTSNDILPPAGQPKEVHEVAKIALVDSSSKEYSSPAHSIETRPGLEATTMEDSVIKVASQTTYKPRYAHELRRGGMQEADWVLAGTSKAKSSRALFPDTPSSPKSQTKTAPFLQSHKSRENTSVGTKTSIPHLQAKLPGTKVLPNVSPSPESMPTTFFTYRAQLTFNLTQSKDGVNVAKFFRRWIYSSSESIDNFALVPYDDDKGQQISSIDQVPEDNASFYSAYYHNHRVLNHGNLTGMVAFQCTTPWARLKSPNHPFFNWLRLNKVFLNQTKFKASSLVPCGFLLGAHPGYLRRDEAEEELRQGLGYTQDEELPFQLSSRTVSVPIQDDKQDRYAFQAVVVETSTQQAATLREKFFSMGHPTQVLDRLPYTGKYQFVPFLKTKEWTVTKILSLAKLHVRIVQELRPIFLANLQNIHNTINDGITLMQGFYGMVSSFPGGVEGQTATEPLLHSIHNTAKPTTKVVLVHASQHEEALKQLSAIHSILTASIPLEYHDKVFIDSLQAGITGQQIDSISSCNSAAYATELLNKYNPQDGEEVVEVTPKKRIRSVPLTYAAALHADSELDTTAEASKATVSSVTSADLDQLFEKMQKYIATKSDTSAINIEELEAKMSQSTTEVQHIRDQLSNTISSLTSRVDTLSDEMKQHNSKLSSEIQRQNVIILGMQQQFQETMSDFSDKLQAIYHTSNNKSTYISPSASTSKPKLWGEKAP
jgi:hypothetical protein